MTKVKPFARFLLSMRNLILLVITLAIIISPLVHASEIQDDWDENVITNLLQNIVPIYLQRLGESEATLIGSGSSWNSDYEQSMVFEYIGDQEQPSSFNIVLARDGRLLAYGYYDSFNSYYYPDATRFPKYTDMEVIKLAQEFIERLLPEAKGHYGEAIIRYPSPLEANISFPHLVAGIPVYDDGIIVSLNLNNGRVNSLRNWRFNHDKINLPNISEPLLEPQAAWSSLFTQIPLRLSYSLSLSQYGGDNFQKVLSYNWLDHEPFVIEANIGDIQGLYTRLAPHPSSYAYDYGYRSYHRPLSDEEMSLYQLPTKYINSELAWYILEGCPGVNLNNMEIVNALYILDGSRSTPTYFVFLESQDDSNTWYACQFDAFTGELVSFERSVIAYDASLKERDKEDLDRSAFNLMQTIMPEKVFSLEQNPGLQFSHVEGYYEVVFNPLLAGIPDTTVQYRSLWDKTNQSLIYYSSYSSTDYPLAKQQAFKPLTELKALDEITAIVMDNLPFSLYWQVAVDPYTQFLDENAEAKLIYVNNEMPYMMIDPFDGSIMVSNMAESVDYEALIQGEYQEKLVKTADFLKLPLHVVSNLEQGITQSEFLRMLKQLDYGRSDYPSAEYAYDAQYDLVVPQFKVTPDHQLTGIEAVSLMVNKLGYRGIARLWGAFSNPYQVQDNQASYIAVAAWLKLIDFHDFEPHKIYTHKDTILLFYNCLSR